MKTTRLASFLTAALVAVGCDPAQPQPQPQPTNLEPITCQEGTTDGLFYVDADGDGFGAGKQVHVCRAGAVVPTGYSTLSGDCDDADASRWRLASFAFRDADGDGWSVAVPDGHVCAGDKLPAGYSEVAGMGADCDDASATRFQSVIGYLDADGDGVGAGPEVALCAGVSLPIGYGASGGDCAPVDASRWRLASYAYRDADGDGWTVAVTDGSVCAGGLLPTGYSDAPGLGADCDDASATRFQPLVGYLDADGDGLGAGSPVTLCTAGALPAGYVEQGHDCDDGDPSRYLFATVYVDGDGDGVGDGELSPDGGSPSSTTLCVGKMLPAGYASHAGDCAPADVTRWQMLTYQHIDRDGDGYTVAASGTVCAGATLPAGYATELGKGEDCDDADPTHFSTRLGFVDADGDGVGAGSAVSLCTGAELPLGYSTQATDCAPDDAARWQLLGYVGTDRDGDGATGKETGSVCTGSVLPEPFRAVLEGNDCDDADALRWRWVLLYPDADGDGVGAPPRTVQCLGASLPSGFSTKGWDVDDGDPALTADIEEDSLLEVMLDLF